jgi:hypothetical protein
MNPAVFCKSEWKFTIHIQSGGGRGFQWLQDGLGKQENVAETTEAYFRQRWNNGTTNSAKLGTNSADSSGFIGPGLP